MYNTKTIAINQPTFQPSALESTLILSSAIAETATAPIKAKLKKWTDPFYFFKKTNIQEPITEEEKFRNYSHIYLGKIKYLKEQHQEQKEELLKKIAEKEERIKTLEVALQLKINSFIKEKIEKEDRAIEMNRNTIANFRYLRRNTLEYVLGHDTKNKLIIGDLSKDAQLLISGRTGSGKTVTTLNILMSITHNNTPKSLKISLIDPKILTFGDHRVESSPFLNEKPSIGDNEQALKILRDAYNSMMKRYKLMRKAGVKNYKKIGLHAHVIFIDEVFELLEGSDAKEILSLLTRIASLGRAGGVHLVLATQSPRAKTLSGTLKANLCFIGHKMSNNTESTLIGLKDAHNLKGLGDGLREIEGKITRFQATFLDEESDQSYIYLNPIHPKRTDNPKQTQNAPKTDPKQQPDTLAIDTEKQAIIALSRDIIATVDENGQLKPKSYFIDTKKRDDLKKWTKTMNLLHKQKEIVYFKNGIGYFLNVDYNTALNILGEIE